MNEDKAWRRFRDRFDNYQQTTRALLAFAAFVVHDGTRQREGGSFGIGRRMNTSEKNRIAPNSQITPDLVAQKSPSYGLVAEAKKSLPRDTASWESCIEQLRKYDDVLTGWWTTSRLIAEYNAVLLIHHPRSRAFVRHLNDLITSDPTLVGPRSSVVEFGASVESVLYYFFRLEFGSLRDPELHLKLEDGIQIPFDGVLRSYPNLRYYDSEPPLEYLLTELWTDIFPAMAAEVQRDENTNSFPLHASVGRLTEELQQAYGSASLPIDERSVEFPKHAWVRRALETLVSYRLATPPNDGGDVYVIQYRPFKKDILDRFIELAVTREAAGPDDGQLDLFSGAEESDA